MDRVIFRAYQPADLDALHALDTACFAEPFRFSRRLMKFLVEARHARTVIAEESGAVVGFLILHIEPAADEDVAYVMTLDVAADQRRRGLATQLMQRAEEIARTEPATALTLHVWTENEGAIRFYERMGYRRVGHIEHFYNEAGDAWLYRKPLT